MHPGWKTAVVLLFAVLSAAVPVRAQDPQPVCAPTVSLRRAQLQYLGQPGVWFHEQVTRCMLADLRELRELRPLSADLQLRLSRSDERIMNLQSQIQLADQARNVAQTALDEAVRGRREAEEERDSWTRAPALWASLGAGTGVVVTWLILMAVR